MLPLLNNEVWPASVYRRDQLPERVLQFGSGMLLRALCAAAVDSANRASARAGRIVVVQSTVEGAARASALNAQDGLYTLVERGLSGGVPLERSGLVGAISRALAADNQWNVVRDVAANPSIQVPATNIPAGEARDFAHAVLERFANPWLEHEWRVIATNQEAKFLIRVVPLIVASFRTRVVAEPALQGTDKTPASCLALAAAAHLTFTRAPVDALGEASRIPDFVAATTPWMAVLARNGVEAALSQMMETAPCS